MARRGMEQEVVGRGEEGAEAQAATSTTEETVTQFYLSKHLRAVCGGTMQASMEYACAMIVNYVMEKDLVAIEGAEEVEPEKRLVLIDENLRMAMRTTADETPVQMAGEEHMAGSMRSLEFMRRMTHAVTMCDVVPTSRQVEEEWWRVSGETTATEETVTQFLLSEELRAVCGVKRTRASIGCAYSMIEWSIVGGSATETRAASA